MELKNKLNRNLKIKELKLENFHLDKWKSILRGIYQNERTYWTIEIADNSTVGN